MRVYAISVALAAAWLCLVHSASLRAGDEDWRAQVTIRELRQRSATITAAKPQAPFFLPADATNKGGVFGADVSHWDFDCDCPSGCTIDWGGAVSNQGIRFVYAEATRDVTSLDPTFRSTWQALKSLHENGQIYRGAYHWLSSDSQIDGASQAQWFLRNFQDGGAHLAHALDFEPDFVEVPQERYNAINGVAECKTNQVNRNGQKVTIYLCDGWYGQSAEAIVSKLTAWIQAVEQNNEKAIIYTTTDYWNRMVADKGTDLLASRGVWLARYLDPAGYPDKGKPQSTIAPTNKWGMPPLPKNVSYPLGSAYGSRTNWQFEQCGQYRQTVWTCNGKPSAGPAPDTNACPTATGAVMDMSWYPSVMADFKAAFGIQ